MSVKANGMSALIERFDIAEYRLCRRLNRVSDWLPSRTVFRAVSRLGDGVVWYVLILALPLLYGASAVRTALAMSATGLLGLAAYKWLKRTFVRERPFIRHREISLAQAPLDRYSFPSGHTLHAVCFTAQAVVFAPELAWALVPLAALIAMSRVVLGLHYPTDVAVGAFLGGVFAALGVALV